MSTETTWHDHHSNELQAVWLDFNNTRTLWQKDCHATDVLTVRATEGDSDLGLTVVVVDDMGTENCWLAYTDRLRRRHKTLRNCVLLPPRMNRQMNAMHAVWSQSANACTHTYTHTHTHARTQMYVQWGQQPWEGKIRHTHAHTHTHTHTHTILRQQSFLRMTTKQT